MALLVEPRLGQIWVDRVTRELTLVKWEHKTFPGIYKLWNPVWEERNKNRPFQSQFSINHLNRMVLDPEEWL